MNPFEDELGKCECSRCGVDPYMEPFLKVRVEQLMNDIKGGWTEITEDPNSLPPEGVQVLGYKPNAYQFLAICELMIRDDGLLWSYAGASAHEKALPNLRPTHWKLIDHTILPSEGTL